MMALPIIFDMALTTLDSAFMRSRIAGGNTQIIVSVSAETM